MEKYDHLVVLHQARIARRASGKVADQRTLWQLPPGDARNQRRAGEPLVFSRARVHVEIDAPQLLSPLWSGAVIDIEGRDRRIPDLRVRYSLKLDMKEARRRLQYPRLHLDVGEI